MTIPPKFKLNGHTWTVEFSDTKLDFKGSPARGICYYGERRIVIWTKQRPKKLLSTFLHEFLHAVEAEYNVRIPHAVIYAVEGPLSEIFVVLLRLMGGTL